MAVEFSSTVKAGRLIRLYGWITLVLASGVVLAIIIPYIHKQVPIEVSIIAIVAAIYVYSIVFLVVGSGIKRHKTWAKISGIVLTILAMPSFPIGTVIGIIALIYLVKGWDEPAPAS